MTTAALERLGRLVRQRRMALGINRDVASHRAGFSRETWRKIEGGEKVSDYSLARAERVLGWPPGTIDGVLEGGDPPMDAAPPMEHPPGWAEMDEAGKLDYVERLLAELRENQRRSAS